MPDVAKLQVVVGADIGPLQKGLADANRSVSGFGGTLAGIGGTIATAFAGAAVAGVAAVGGAFAASTLSASGFEKQLSSIKAVSGSTAAEMDTMRALALELGAATSFSATEAAQGIEELIKAGVSVGDVLGGGAAAAMNLAAAGAVSVKDAAELTSNALNAFGLAGADAAHVADLIAGAANASAIDVGDFKFSLAAVGAVAKTVGFAFDDTAAAIALLGNAGIKGSDAGTSLKTMFLNLQPATDKQTALFRELGLITADGANKFFDAAGNVRSMAEVAGTLQDALKGMTAQQKLATLETIFGSDAIRAAAVFAEQGAEGITSMAEAMSKVTAEAVAQERLNNVAGAWEQVTGAAETAAITFGSHLLPGLTEMLKWGDSAISDLIPTLDEVGKSVGGALSEGVTRAKDLFRQLGDAGTTAKQAFEGDWAPDASIEPLAQAAGNAATKVKELRDFIGEASDRASQMGAWDNLTRGMGNLRDTAQSIPKHLSDIAGSLDRLNGASGGATTKIDLLAIGLKGVATGFEVWSLSMMVGVDTMVLVSQQAIKFLTVLSSVGQGVYALATGDMETFKESFKTAGGTMLEMVADTAIWQQRTEENVRKGARAIGLNVSEQTTLAQAVGSVQMQKLADAVESNMSAANQSVGTNSAGMQQFLEANGAGMVSATETSMAGIVGAVQGQAPVAVAAAEGMGTGMVSGLEAAAPGMATAAEGAASGAVAAVQGQAGPASAAGSAVGSSAAQGIASGVQAGEGGILAAIKGVIARMWAAAWGPEGIDAHSPSKKGVALAENVSESIEATLRKADLSDAITSQIQDMLDAAHDYMPVAGQIARVEREIKDLRDESQTDALFRAESMVGVESELLRIKRDQATAERDLLPLRREVADAEREVRDISEGSLADRTRLLDLDTQRKQLRLQTLDLEKALVGLDRDSKRAQTIQDQIDKLQDQDRALSIEQDRIRTTNDLAASSARARALGLGEILTAQERNTEALERQIGTLSAEEAVFRANEAIIKNATDNEIAYRQKLIAVFNAEGKPLTDRIANGLALVDQLEAEGKISKELADELRKVGKEAGISAEANRGLGAAASTATPQLDAAARKAAEMAAQARAMADGASSAEHEINDLAKALGKLPDWFTPKGSGSGSIFGGGRAAGGPVSAGVPYVVGEHRPELFVPEQDGYILPAVPAMSVPPVGLMNGMSGGSTDPSSPMQTIRLEIAIGNDLAEEIYVTGRDITIKRTGDA